MKASEFFSILCDQILTPVEGMTAEDFDKFPPLILSHLETVEKATTRWVFKPPPSSYQPWYEEKEFHPFDSRMVLASALRLKEMGDE